MEFPLSIAFIYCPEDQVSVVDLIDLITNYTSKGDSTLFSRNLDIPYFTFSSKDVSLIPEEVILESHKKILIVFTSINTLGNDNWKEYYENLNGETFNIVPVAIDNYGLRHSGVLSGVNCIRAYEGIDEWTVLWVLNEIYRFSFSSANNQFAPVKVFLSHAKSDDAGVKFAKGIKDFIDNTSLDRFFDATDIPPAHDFEHEINKNLEESSLLIFYSDNYAASYWCQKEVITAKKLDRPIVVVNCLESFQDRLLPAVSNVPCCNFSVSESLNDNIILNVLILLVSETIRLNYSKEIINFYGCSGVVPKDYFAIVRPPEIRNIISLKANGIDKICYPDPPLYRDEISWVEELGVEAITPISGANIRSLSNKVFTLSISDVSGGGSDIHPKGILNLISKKLVKYLFAGESKLQYGGDFRKEGYTNFILTELKIQSNIVLRDVKPLSVYAVPVTKTTNMVEFNANYVDLFEVVDVDCSGIDFNDEKINSICQLSKLRLELIANTDFLISVGGKESGFRGIMPGVLEEVLIAIAKKKPLFLISSYGGVSKQIYNFFCGDLESISYINGIFESVLEYIEANALKEKYIDYEIMIREFKNTKISDLARICNVTASDYERLSSSKIPDVNVSMILKVCKGLV